MSSLYLSRFCGASVIIIGHTGFKGAWLTAWLKQLGANITGIALDPTTSPSHFTSANIGDGINDLRIDLRDHQAIECAIIEAQPDFVFHLAAQAFVRRSYNDPIETWHVNVLGTLHVLESLRKINKRCAAVIVTSDKCYENVEWVWGYRETDALGGADPYSASKAAVELAVRSHVKSFFSKSESKVRICSARAGNVIGGGDWGEDRIIPDCVRAWSLEQIAELRRPNATRPWQHVLEPLSGYLNLALALFDRQELHGESFNFGPPAQQNYTVLELVTRMAQYWERVRWKDVSSKANGPYESSLLKLNCDKALFFLRWHAVMPFDVTVHMTAEWYRNFYFNSLEIETTTIAQITTYMEYAERNGLEWAR